MMVAPAAVPEAQRRSVSVLGVEVDTADLARVREIAHGWLRERRRSYIAVVNVHAVMEAQSDPALRSIYNRADLTVPDGMPLVWLGRMAGHAAMQRVYGPDLTLLLCELASRHGYSCYYYGGGAGVGERLAAAMETRFSGLRTAGHACPPFRPLTEAEDVAAIAAINQSQADIVFVGLGCPKQDHWMATHRAKLDAPILVGVGAAFDFHAGLVRQAPGWMQRSGLEWLFRLLQEPTRLWRRYLVLNPLFIAHTAMQLLGLRRYPRGRPPTD